MLFYLALLLAFAAPHSFAIENAILKGNWEEVVNALEKDDSKANNPMSLWLKGYACLIKNDYQDATKCFMQFSSSANTPVPLDYANELVRKNPGNAVAQMLKGDVLARNGKYSDSLLALDEAVRLDLQSALLYDVRGVVKTLADMPDEASADFEKAIELNSKFADPLANLGIIRLAEEDFVGALEYLNQAIELSQNFALAYNARGVLYNNLKAWEQSESDFSKAKELLPELAFVSGNQRLLSWTIGQEQFKIARMAENQGDGRGASLLASTYERYSVDIGDGRTVDVFNIKNTPQTATLSGMETTLRHITSELRTEAKLPEDWKPNILIAQPGLGSSAYAERRNFAKMAFSSGKDFVISTDTTDKFQWGIKAPIIDEDVARRIERTIVASNHVFGSAPDLLVESQASRLLGKPQHGSATLSSLFEQGKLHTDFKVNRCIAVGVPFYDMKVNDQLKSDRFKDIVSFSTKYTMTGIVPNASLPGISNIELTLPKGKPPTHGSLFAEQWPSRMANPVPDLAGMYLRGMDVKVVQDYAINNVGKPRMYTTGVGDPATTHLSMATMTRRGLTFSDAVIIGCKDPKLGEMMKAQFGDTWRVEVVRETNPAKLYQIAAMGKFSHINNVADNAPANQLGKQTGNLTNSSPYTLSEIRSVSKNIDIFYKSTKLIYDLAGAKMPGGVSSEITMALAAPLFEDIHSARKGVFRPEVSRSLERIGELGANNIYKLKDVLTEKNLLPKSFNIDYIVPPGLTNLVAGMSSQIGGGKQKPTLQEWDNYCKGVGKMAAFALGTSLTTSPDVGRKVASGVGLVYDIAPDFIAQQIAKPLYYKPIQKNFVDSYNFHVGQYAKRGLPMPPLKEYATGNMLQELGFNSKMITDVETNAGLVYAKHAFGAQLAINNSKLPDYNLQNVPVISTPRQDEIWKKIPKSTFPGPPNDFGGGSIPTTKYRIPSSSLSGVKPGGVLMKTDVVKGKQADTSEMFGTDAGAQSETQVQQQGLICPFLLFCAMP